MSTQNAPAQRVPAWKRLGLKLKGAVPDQSPAFGSPAPGSGPDNVNANHSASTPASTHSQRNQLRKNAPSNAGASPANGNKRKLPPTSTPSRSISQQEQTPSKRQRTADTSSDKAPSSTTLKKQKSVTFAEEHKESSHQAGSKPAAADTKKSSKPKKKKVPRPSTRPDFSIEPALAYLRQWQTARASWKFNKNHQTLLIKYVFDGDKIPSADTTIFYEYIRDLKGFVRSRLREAAEEITKKDMEQGAAGFPEAVKDKEAKQKEYDQAISQFLQQKKQESGQQQNGGSAKTNGKRSFEEVDFVLRQADPIVKQRLIKRIRAQMVLDELSDSDESSTSTETVTTVTPTTSSVGEDVVMDVEKRARANDGPQQKVKRRRLRNARTDISDDDSSSEEEEDSDASSSSSSSEDSDDEIMPDQDMNDSSSSSSSSSSESESGAGETDEEASSDEESSSSSSDEED